MALALRAISSPSAQHRSMVLEVALARQIVKKTAGTKEAGIRVVRPESVFTQWPIFVEARVESRERLEKKTPNSLNPRVPSRIIGLHEARNRRHQLIEKKYFSMYLHYILAFMRHNLLV